jgi:hypothetical protein
MALFRLTLPDTSLGTRSALALLSPYRAPIASLGRRRTLRLANHPAKNPTLNKPPPQTITASISRSVMSRPTAVRKRGSALRLLLTHHCPPTASNVAIATFDGAPRQKDQVSESLLSAPRFGSPGCGQRCPSSECPDLHSNNLNLIKNYVLHRHRHQVEFSPRSTLPIVTHGPGQGRRCLSSNVLLTSLSCG